MKRFAFAKYFAIWLVVLLAGPQYLTAAVATERPTLPDPGHTRYSKEQQEQLGQKAKAEVYKQMPVLPDSSPVTHYVQQLGHKLDSVIPADRNWPYEFHVIQQKDINAFALPGGPIFVNVGTILAAKNEAQLAGVIAHEMSHVYMQHSIKGMEQQQKTGILAGIAGIAGAVAGLGNLGQVAAGTIGGLYDLHYSRGDEAQADHVGAIIMYLAGYNPIELANFFRQLETQGGTPPQFLSDHPNPGNRFAAVTDEIKNWAPENYVTDTPQFTQVKAEAQNVKVYTAQQIAQMAKSGQIHNTRDSASQTDSNDSDDDHPPVLARKGGPTSSSDTPSSVTPSSITPSGAMSTYDNDVFTISRPSNWQVTNGGGGDIMITPQSGIDRGQIAYGALINQTGSTGDLNQDFQRLVTAMQRDNPNMRTAGSPQAITINGRKGLSQDLIGTSPIEKNGSPEQERDRLVIVPTNDGNVLYVIFVSPESDYGKLQGTYQSMLRSLQVR